MARGIAKALGCAVVVLLVAALGACGDDDDEPETSATADDAADDGSTGDPDDDGAEEADEDEADVPIDACGALAGVDLDALLGAPASEPEDASTAQGAACTIGYVDGSGGGSLAVITTRAADNYEEHRELYGVDTEVSGLGDRAFHSGPYLIVLDGERLVRLQVVRDAALGTGVADAELEAAMGAILTDLGS